MRTVQNRRGEEIRMERVRRPSQTLNFDMAAESFRTETAVHEPLLVPLMLERASRRLAHERRDRRCPERPQPMSAGEPLRPAGNGRPVPVLSMN